MTEQESPQKVDKEKIKKEVIEKVLKKVHDPEIPISVWDLGLVYNLDVTDDGIVKIKMTLTSPTCPIAGQILWQIVNGIKAIPGVKDVDLDLTFDPPWTPFKMKEEGRKKFKEIYGYDIVEEYKAKYGSEEGYLRAMGYID
ncbi:phenylacetic acid degradation protein [Ignicoccus islandicus DSM 13165]|uniref:Phenylacetic acid degradation protein n=1 Tax=Ignicoccus islandicus DSM 13165 TaxID=940295 RepID=A0A0U2VBZ3_9CREN|nr:iron-sulfur cluster assembly protein [Ignicoccus islandicus]ALU11618.1 phenylacetic acid degradation protein [Ignicoccus islandicus DSM 13165]